MCNISHVLKRLQTSERALSTFRWRGEGFVVLERPLLNSNFHLDDYLLAPSHQLSYE
jgi:hypothetical protein